MATLQQVGSTLKFVGAAIAGVLLVLLVLGLPALPLVIYFVFDLSGVLTMIGVAIATILIVSFYVLAAYHAD
jgi:hypothetical protein